MREFSWHKDSQGFAGWYYSSTMRDHVAYEPWLERDRLILLDRDPHVVAVASQPFWLHGHDGTRKRRHAPDHQRKLCQPANLRPRGLVGDQKGAAGRAEAQT